MNVCEYRDPCRKWWLLIEEILHHLEVMLGANPAPKCSLDPIALTKLDSLQKNSLAIDLVGEIIGQWQWQGAVLKSRRTRIMSTTWCLNFGEKCTFWQVCKDVFFLQIHSKFRALNRSWDEPLQESPQTLHSARIKNGAITVCNKCMLVLCIVLFYGCTQHFTWK